MGQARCTRLAALGMTTLITLSNIHFLDNRFHPLATSRKVCDAWREQSEAKGKWHSARRWSTPGSRLGLARKTWQTGSDATSPLLPALKAVSAGSMSSSWSFWPAPLVLTRSSYWRSSKPPRSQIIEFEADDLSKTPVRGRSERSATPCRNSQRHSAGSQ